MIIKFDLVINLSTAKALGLKVPVLVAEYAQATQRGRVIGAVQSAWSIGYAGVLIANTLAFSLASPDI